MTIINGCSRAALEGPEFDTPDLKHNALNFSFALVGARQQCISHWDSNRPDVFPQAVGSKTDMHH